MPDKAAGRRENKNVERLTERNEYGEAYYKRCYASPCEGTGESCDNCDLIDIEVCEALAAYEDTGITPDQMREISRLYQIKCEELIACQRNEHNNGWIPCSERLPENEKHKGAFCPRYWLMTKYGQTVGWYNPDRESWFVLIWFMTGRLLKEEIDLERGDVPKLVRVPLNTGIVIAWQPLPEPYQPKGE